MNLEQLFEVQRKLDAEIERKHPIQRGEDRLAKRILALQVELGECANEWRGFKFWSKNQEPRRSVYKQHFKEGTHGPSTTWHDPLLEEYVDCLHFILSIGIDLDFTSYERNDEYEKPKDTSEMFIMINEEIAFLSRACRESEPRVYLRIYYSVIFDALIALSEMLGFTWEQIEVAYMSKNKINHERQANGY